jgi:hypothetical protein
MPRPHAGCRGGALITAVSTMSARSETYRRPGTISRSYGPEVGRLDLAEGPQILMTAANINPAQSKVIAPNGETCLDRLPGHSDQF